MHYYYYSTFFAELELGEKRARLKRVNIHWPILTKIGHFDSVAMVVVVPNSWIITIEKYPRIV